jgi:peptidyl-prolyl cis-trans isomerase NIMA-interacting 1
MVWVEKVSRTTGKPYYFNTDTNESTYDRPKEMGAPQGQVRVRHCLKKHAGSRRPASWRCDNITQSKEEAIAQIQAIISQIESSSDIEGTFSEIASTESDCSSAQRGGDLGFFGPGQMQKAFEEASFALEVGQLSGIVDSDSGIHVILRVG